VTFLLKYDIIDKGFLQSITILKAHDVAACNIESKPHIITALTHKETGLSTRFFFHPD